jgi:hypothetical protein
MGFLFSFVSKRKIWSEKILVGFGLELAPALRAPVFMFVNIPNMALHAPTQFTAPQAPQDRQSP